MSLVWNQMLSWSCTCGRQYTCRTS